MTDPAAHRPRVVIIGGGFGGLHAARALRRAEVDVTLIDRSNFHLFQPLLYQVATGGLSPANIAAPLRAVLRRQKNARVLQAEVTGFDLERRRVLIAGGEVEYDYLIVAAGSTHSYFGHDDWSLHAPGLKSIDDATEIRAQVLSAFERAELCEDPAERARLLTFVIVGAGPTGVEMAGALSELSRYTLRGEFRSINPADARIVLVDASPRVLSVYPPELSAKAARFLDEKGVEVQNGVRVTQVTATHVELDAPTGPERIESETIIWAAGVAASPLARRLADAAGLEVDRAGRIPIGDDLTIAGHDNVMVIGDMACFAGKDGHPLPGVAPVAIQQGKHAARRIQNLQAGDATPPFKYHDMGSMATIGRSAAVVSMGRLKFAGFFAWVMWLFVHLMQLVNFQNRLLVLTQWAWSYVTRNRSARLITRTDHHASEQAAELQESSAG
ncbi:NADH dehydrogenase-like protein [Posidoniimonas corsicana]|uniref:NADH:ubiquinone reductase (non-electrogenic) n=1 Tax=Posidoniimonas corsicana TaxID=1938618 RepID=A0A5C5V681_9BACT|nr:NAD(P)/FAD-dependent oxidoreductase [Posidoniimonas corsicana]TWT33463.1 NADH dehydrogenase-like protein [Posidoniimonas corsicana]